MSTVAVKALITGASGQIGRMLLKDAPGVVDATGVSHQQLDIADEKSVMNCLSAVRPQVIINCAAYTAVDRAEDDADNALRVNAVGPRLLAEAARRIDARLIHLSTDFVFDGAASRPYRTDAATNPLNVYGRTKLGGEQAVLETLPGRSVVLRTAWVYAAEGANFVRTMLRLMAEKKSVRVVADQVGTPTAARSIAKALWAIAAQPQIDGIQHWTDAGTASWYDFAVAIAEESAQRGLLPQDVEVTPIRAAEFPARATRPGYSVLDSLSLAAQLGFAPVHWRTNLRAVLGELAHG